MSDNINITSFSEAQALASKFDLASANLQELIAFCKNVSGGMQAIWQGDAMTNFMLSFEEINGALNKMVPLVAELKTQADQKLAAIIGANH